MKKKKKPLFVIGHTAPEQNLILYTIPNEIHGYVTMVNYLN